MRNFPKKPKGKGKRWARGQSSNSNPETKKFRDAAKSTFFQQNTGGPSALTVGAIKTLDAFNNKKYGLKTFVKEETVDDTTTIDSWASSKTFKTFASDWSDCTNPSFKKLLNDFQPKSALHKEMLAVLAAVTEVIKSNGGNETSTEYFGALITTLGVTEEEDTVSAILTLLSMGIKSVPNEVLRLKFSECSKIFLDLLVKYSELENPVILRAVIGCLSVILRAQDPVNWSYPSTLQLFHSILVFSTHSRPRIRKAGQHAICAILKESSLLTSEKTHPAAATAAKYCINQLTLENSTTTLYILSLLKEIISTFPRIYIKTTCEALLKLIIFAIPLVVTSSFEVLHELFVSASPNRLDTTLNAQIINALYDSQPSVNNSQATLSWLIVMQEAHRALSRSDPKLCGNFLSKFFSTVTDLWLCENNDIKKGCTVCLRVISMDCIKACRSCNNYSYVCQTVFGIVEERIKFQFDHVLGEVFSILGVLFEVVGIDGADYMTGCLKVLGNLRKPQNFHYMTQLDYTIGTAIRFLGPEIVLKSIPINITGNETNYDFPTSWLLPVLKDNIQTSTLKFFIEYFLPMASICERKSKEFNAANDKIKAHSYDLLQLQIWSLLPPFCNNPPDIKENFKTIAKILGDIINNKKYLRVHAMAALRKLIIKSQERNNKEDINELSRFSKNYLPILFNFYITKPIGTDEGGERLAAFDTIKVYLTITESEQCWDLYNRALKRINEMDKSDIFTKESIMDLLKLLIPYQNKEMINVTFHTCLKNLRTTKCRKEEKKFFRLLEVIVGSNSETCKEFTRSKQKEIISFLLKSIKFSKSTNRGARLRCIFYMVKTFSKGHFKVIKALIPETVLCCKDINKNTRTFAFRLLEEMYLISRTWFDKSNEDFIRDYISIIIGGLIGTPTLISATILALGKLTYSMRSEIPPDVAHLMLENICLLSSLPNRDIVGSALGYMKIFLTSFKKEKLVVYIPTLVKAIASMAEDCKSHFRLKTRDVLDRLIRKFGYDTVRPLIPADDIIMLKRLKNLRRINEKKKMNKLERGRDDELEEMEEFAIKCQPKSIEEILASSDESEAESESNTPKEKHKGKSEVFIEEDAENIVDLISPSVSSKISAVAPVTEKRKKSGFKTTADGRMIIIDDDAEENDDSIGDEEDSDIDKRSVKSDIGRKRKMSASSDVPAKYQAGGSGIHRPIRQPRGKGSKKRKKQRKDEMPSLKTGKEYRAKKAKGDVKLKGKPDPYAYIPLSRKMLNKRKKLKNIVTHAIKGTKLGAKLKMKRKK